MQAKVQIGLEMLLHQPFCCIAVMCADSLTNMLVLINQKGTMIVDDGMTE